MGAAACAARGQFAGVPRQPGASCAQQLVAEVAPAAAGLRMGTGECGGRQGRDVEDGEESRPSLKTAP